MGRSFQQGVASERKRRTAGTVPRSWSLGISQRAAEQAGGSPVASAGVRQTVRTTLKEQNMRLLPILAAATIGVFAVTAVNAQGTQQRTQQGAGNPSGTQNMDTANKGNPNTPSAGQTTGTGSKAAKKNKKKKTQM
jgi:hypothetical protein